MMKDELDEKFQWSKADRSLTKSPVMSDRDMAAENIISFGDEKLFESQDYDDDAYGSFEISPEQQAYQIQSPKNVKSNFFQNYSMRPQELMDQPSARSSSAVAEHRPTQTNSHDRNNRSFFSEPKSKDIVSDTLITRVKLDRKHSTKAILSRKASSNGRNSRRGSTASNVSMSSQTSALSSPRVGTSRRAI